MRQWAEESLDDMTVGVTKSFQWTCMDIATPLFTKNTRIRLCPHLVLAILPTTSSGL